MPFDMLVPVFAVASCRRAHVELWVCVLCNRNVPSPLVDPVLARNHVVVHEYINRNLISLF